MDDTTNIRIYMNEKEMVYSHQNIVGAINLFLHYLTNDDLNDMMETVRVLKEHRKVKEAEAHEEMEKHSWPYPDTIIEHEVKN